MTSGRTVSGVYHRSPDGNVTLVHAYTDDDYELSDIIDLFALGAMEPVSTDPGPVFAISRRDLRRMKVQADAESFDHPEGFIEMCMDIYRLGEKTDAEPLRFFSVE